MRVLCYPLLHLYRNPEAINTKGDKCEQEPLDILTEELSAGAVEYDLIAVDDRVFSYPSLLDAYCPRQAEAESKRNKQAAQNLSADKSQ